MDRGDEESFRTFVATWSPGLLRTAYLLTGDHGHAEDLLQTALLKTARHWRRLERPEAAFGYVRKVLVNTHISEHRRRRVPEHLVDDLGESPLPAHEHYAGSDRTAAALAGLPPGMRAVLVLRYYEDLSEAQTAAALGCSTGNVKSQASRALARLRRELDPAGDSADTDVDIAPRGRP